MKYTKIILLLIFLASFLFLCKSLFLGYYPDFSDYYFGGKVLLHGGNPYLAKDNFFTPYVYPPFVLFFFTPFLLFPFQVAEIVWTGISIFLLFVSVVFLLKMYHQKLYSISSLLIAIFVCWYFPVKFSLGMGQVNIAVFFLITLGIYLYHSYAKKSGGFVLSLPILLKFFPLLIIIYFGIKKEWRFLSIFIPTILIGGIGALFLLNSTSSSFFLTHVLPGYFSGWKGDYYNQSFSGVLVRAGVLTPIGEILRNLFSLIGIGITCIAMFFASKKKSIYITNVSIGALIAVSLLANNFSWQHHFVWLLFPLIATFFAIGKLKRKTKYYVLFVLVFVLTATNIKNPTILPVFFQSHVFYGAFLLWVMNIWILYREKFSA